MPTHRTPESELAYAKARRFMEVKKEMEEVPTSGQVASIITDVPAELLRRSGYEGTAEDLYRDACFQVAYEVFRLQAIGALE